MAGKRFSGAKLEQLCRMQAEAILSAKVMAQKLSVSVRTVERYLSRPEVQQRVKLLSRQDQAAGQRLANSRARWAVGRLIQLSNRDDETGRKALVDLLKLALGQAASGGSAEPQAEQNNNQVTEELTRNWTDNEWDIFAKLLASGGQTVRPAQTQD